MRHVAMLVKGGLVYVDKALSAVAKVLFLA
jgi:hypothetical protein